MRNNRINTNEVLYYEKVTNRIGNKVLESKLWKATKQQINKAKRLHKQGNCPHTIVKDEPGWLYDTRSCAICGQGLGTI